MRANLRIAVLTGFVILPVFIVGTATAQVARKSPPVNTGQLPVNTGGGLSVTTDLKTSLPESNTPKVQVPVVAVPASASASPPAETTHLELSCDVVLEQCANPRCYPLGAGWSSYRDCIITECRLEQQNCIDYLVNTLEKRND